MENRRILLWILISLISGHGVCSLCPSTDTESLLQVNNVYTYRFRSEAFAQAVGTTEDQGKIALECDVHVAHERACFYHLDLHNCIVTASGGEPGSQTAWIDHQPLPDLSKYPVAFALSNGEIIEVKTHDEDPLYYVNIKRGVLSSFVFKLSQTKTEMKESHTDIHGTCPLTSVPVNDGDGTVRTSKEMLLCNFPSKPDWQFSPWSLFWNMSFIQHLINSTTDCEYKIHEQGKRIDRVFCKERHAIMLESTHRTTAAVQTNVFYNLEFVKLEVQTSKPVFPILTRKTDIRFEYEDTPVPQSSPPNFLPAAQKMLSDLVLDSLDEVRLFTIPQFTNFVGWIRSSHDLKPLVDSVKDCSFLASGAQCDQRVKELAQSYLTDALLQCNNLPCAKSLTYLVTSDSISPIYLNSIFQSWSYMHYSKPGFVTNFAEICRLKNSHQCWMSLATFSRRIYSRNNDLDDKVLQEITEVATHFYNRIAEECEVTEDTEKIYTDCLIFLKATSNMGKLYNNIVPDGVNQLLDLSTDEDSPLVIRTSALEALKDIFDQDQQHKIYDKLLPLMKSASSAPSIRILSYDQLLLVSEGYNFQEHLFTVLKEDENSEVKLYIAESLNSLTTDNEFKSSKLLQSLLEMLQENELSLENIIYDTKGKSKSTTLNMFLDFPFLPDYMKRFGLKLRDSFIYDSNIYPTVFNQETIFQLFSAIVPSAKMASFAEGWEELILSYTKNVADMDGQPGSFAKISDALLKTLGEYGQLEEESLQNFHENVLSNLKKIHRLYWEHHKKLKPYAKAYLDLFGSTVKYFVEDSIKSASGNEGMAKLLNIIGQRLAEGVTYNSTRVIRIIEAYHQVPTMMGLPLNWTTNATLAFSIRAGLKFQMNKENNIHSKGFFQPSAALTFFNRMVLDFPTLTQIGVQANSSGYTSTEWRGQFNSAKGKQSFRIERPSRTQKFLELFRTNQMIKHNNYEDIPDWDIERTFSSWCTKDNSALGLKFCLAKSYPSVTHRINKPWALMAGWCKWQFLAHPTSGRADVHYDLALQQASIQKVKEITAKFSVTDNDKEKSANFKAAIEENGKDVKLELKTSLMPDFIATFSKRDLIYKKASGHKIDAVVQLFKDFKYELQYADEGKVQRTTVERSSLSEDSHTLVNEEHLNLKTPYSAYAWNKTVYRNGENSKAEASLSYENVKSESGWMKNILPSAFWENDRKASLNAFFHWKKPIYTSQDTVTRQTEFRLRLPRYVMALTGNSLKNSGREQITVNIAKTDVNHGKLDAFLSFTSDYWTNELNRRIQLVNVTIPRRSWSVTYEEGWAQNAPKYHNELSLRRAVMKPRNDLDKNYVGWWSDEISDRFTVEEKEIKLTSDIDVLTWSSKNVADKFPSVSYKDLEGLTNTVYDTKIVLSYPFGEKIESVDFEGFFISSSGGSIYRFQKTFDMVSSYNLLKLTSHSVFRIDGGTALYHNSYFTHLSTDTKAYNTIHFMWKEQEGKCSDVEFKHDIRSHVLDLSTDATYKCESGANGLHTLRLNLNSNSSMWNMLDLKLRQVVEDVSPIYAREEMTASHALGTVHVEAEWWSPPYHHQKRVTLCSKDGNCPNAELFLDFWSRDGIVKFSRNSYEISYRNRMSSDDKKLQIEVDYEEKEDTVSKVLEITGELLDRNYHIWKGTLYPNTLQKVRDIFANGYESFSTAFTEVAKDKNHPLNDILRPALKMTLYDYWKELKEEYRDFFAMSWSEVKKVFHVIEAFVDPAYNVLTNSITTIGNVISTMYNRMKDKSVAIWAIDYFHLPYYFQQGIMNLPLGISELWKQLTLGEDGALYFKYISGKILALTSFREWPSVEFNPEELRLSMPFTSGTEYRRNEKDNVAMIFGHLHVYTFDGHLYDIPEYAHSECLYLLAHDVHKSLFSVFSSQKEIHILFPELSLTINDKNEVFVNGSHDSSSLPIQSANGKVTVRNGHLLEVWSPSLSIFCRSQDFLCVLKLHDYHSGGVIGLLGNADDISSNDHMLPTGGPSLTLHDFVRSYEISGKPKCENFRATQVSSLPPSEEEIQICAEKFRDICPKRPNIRETFMNACVSDIKAGHSACYAASALSALCSFKYAPSHTECNAKKQENDKIGHNLEVVLIVQESKYLTSPDKSNSPLKGIASLITAVDSRFKEDGYDSILYSLVGFGGNGVHKVPTIHSSERNIWIDSNTMIKDVLKTLEFKSREEADGVEALKYSLGELGHDSFVSKVFVIITAKDKQVSDKSLMNFVQTHMEENGITLYAISSYPTIEKGKKVFGVRADGLIFPAQTEEGEAYLDYPRGNLAKLASSTRGSVFLTKFLKENQPSAFYTEIAQEIWAKVNKEANKCRSCKSVRAGWWWYRSVCKIVHC